MDPKSVSKYTDNLDEAVEVKLTYTRTVLGSKIKAKTGGPYPFGSTRER